MNLINPKRFFVKGIEPQGKPDEKAEKKDKKFLSF